MRLSEHSANIMMQLHAQAQAPKIGRNFAMRRMTTKPVAVKEHLKSISLSRMFIWTNSKKG